MPDITNPYIPGQPVDSAGLFFGRRDVLSSIREHLVKGQRVFVVSGARRMGKTSLLRQLPAHLPEEFLPVRVDLLDVPQDYSVPHQEGSAHGPGSETAHWLLWRLARAISGQAAQQLGQEDLEPASSVLAHGSGTGQTDRFLEQFWPRVRTAMGDRCLVLMLDDLGSLGGEQVRLLDPLISLLTTWRERDRGIAFVLTTSANWQETLIRKHPGLFGGALTHMLGPLSSEEATRLITWPVDGVVTYDYGVVRRLIEISSGQPYFLQLLCFEVFNRCAPAGWVNQRDVDLVIEALVGQEVADFRQAWDESSPQEQAALGALVSLRGARGIATAQEVRTVLTKAGARADTGQVTAALEVLTTRGILERLGALSYRFQVALLRDWLGERIDLQEVVRHTRWDTQRGGGADQAGSLGGHRVSRLRVRRERRRTLPVSKQEPAATSEGRDSEMAVPGRPWLWIAGAIALSLILLAAAGGVLFVGRGLPWLPPGTPIPTATVLAYPTERLATATWTPVTVLTTKSAKAVSPTDVHRLDTPLPSPTATPISTPTPPRVVARAVPAIAYQSRGPGERRWSIYVMSSSGSDRARLSDGGAEFLSAPAWSSDGSKIAFVADGADAPDIWVMNSDGSDAVNLTQHKAKDHSPAWSPDGEWIAFASVRDSAFWELYVMRADGSDLRRLTWWEDASDLWPTWSPDGTRLAFASKRDGNWEIYAIDRGGSNLIRLTAHPADDTNPAWSPDGSRVAFESTREGYTDIYVMPVAAGRAVNVSNVPWATDLGPTWSPDGGRIAFYSDRDGEWDIYVMTSDGSEVIKLTGDNSNDQVPAWRP